MKVLIADKFEDSGRKGLDAIGCEVLFQPGLLDEALVDALKSSGAEALIVRSTKVTREMLEAGRLSLVIRAGAGYNTIDVEAAAELGIYVSNCPGKNSLAVAELAFGLILALDRRIADNVSDLRNGVWNKAEYSKARGIKGTTLGLIGLGRIGQAMVPRAKAFGMKVVAWSRSLTERRADKLEIGRMASPRDVAAASDIVSVHLAATPETKKLIGRDFFEAMKPGSFFVNTSRADVVDESALAEAVKSRGLRAGLDVFDDEPKDKTGSIPPGLFADPNVIGTHHIGASTDQAQEAIASETVRIVREYMETGRAPNAVNLAVKSPATHMLVVRHFDRVGVLAAVFDVIKAAGINAQETENIVFDGARAAVAHIHLSQAPSGEVLQAIRGSTRDIIEVSLVELDAA